MHILNELSQHSILGFEILHIKNIGLQQIHYHSNINAEII